MLKLKNLDIIAQLFLNSYSGYNFFDVAEFIPKALRANGFQEAAIFLTSKLMVYCKDPKDSTAYTRKKEELTKNILFLLRGGN